MLALFALWSAAETVVPIANPDFEQGSAATGVPAGWELYGRTSPKRKLSVIQQNGSGVLKLEDNDTENEIGVMQTFEARENETYRVEITVDVPPDQSPEGAYVQLRFIPSGTYAQTALIFAESKKNDVVLYGTAPAGTTSARLYIYTHKEPMPQVTVDNVRVTAGVTRPAAKAARSAAMPEPVPPQMETLKPLDLDTPLSTGGQPAAVIVVPADGTYASQADAVQTAIRDRTGVTLPVVPDTDPAAALPLPKHAIALGNRSTNRLISALYDRFYALEDLKYPGEGGYVLRSVHNPLGDHRNIILCAGSDSDGVKLAADALSEHIADMPADDGTLELGWLLNVKLAENLTIPEDIADVRIWEESVMYGSSGYFGWNIISKAMALYAMSGNEAYAREFLRLAFPDAAAVRELEAADGERIENKHDPLAGPYHYSAHMMILFWDLIEESPLFTDEQRLRITNAFSRQLTHRAREHVYGTTTPPASVGNRHGDWSAMSLYALARYFARDYPGPVWDAGLQSVRTYFSALKRSAWLAGYNDHLFWYTSYYDPIFDYMIMSGDRSLLVGGYLEQALRTQDVLFTGNEKDWGLKASSLNFLQRAAYVTGDGRWLFYRDRTGLDTDVFRLGQSFWTDDLEPRPPTELVGRWTVQPMPEPMWQARQTALPLDQTFLWGSFRSTLDHTGDYALIKGHNGGGRNPYHTFSLLELRLAGQTVLKGYHTQVLTNADGLVEPTVAMNAALLRRGVAGGLAFAVGSVPNMAFCTWERTLALKTGALAVVADKLTYRTDSDNLTRLTGWDTVGGAWDPDSNRIVTTQKQLPATGKGWHTIRALDATCTSRPSNDDAPRNLIDLTSIGIRLVKATEPGHYIEMAFKIEKPQTVDVFADLLNYTDRGTVDILLDEQIVAENVDHWSAAVRQNRVPLGKHTLAAGTHTLRIRAAGRRPDKERCYIGLAGIALREPGAAEPPAATQTVELHPADLVDGNGKGAVTLTYRAPVSAGQTDVDFTLIAPGGNAERPLTCMRLAPNAAAMQLPENALAVSGSYEGTDAGLAILSQTGILGVALTHAGVETPLLQADRPVDAEWDFETGELHVNTDAEAIVRIAAATPKALTLDGHPAAAGENDDGLCEVRIPAGRHIVGNVRPPAALRTRLENYLSGNVATAQNLRETQRGRHAAEAARQLPAWPRAADQELSGAIDCLAVCTGSDLAFAASTGAEIATFTADGNEAWRATTDGNIRTLHWWPEHSLLLAGCTNEQVVAFDNTGKQRWVFTSEMDRAVWEAAKQYWFKSAHPGIYGLDTGVFVDGRSQCFVGSACTLEILNPDGSLLERLPVFWGPGWRFGLRDAADGSRDLLVARQPTDTHALSIVNSRSLRVAGRAFDGVPEGHTYVTGWSTMSRNHLFITDLDGDGNDEVVSEINGTWNRITVWNIDGSPRHNAQVGPGKRIPARTVTDLDVADLDGDGRKEIVFTLASGLVVGLDCTCQRLWSVALPSTPHTVCTIPAQNGLPGSVAVGCADGTVRLLDPQGKARVQTTLNGPVTKVALNRTGNNPVLAFGTAKGDIAFFTLNAAP